jgi:hypothetical protein
VVGGGDPGTEPGVDVLQELQRRRRRAGDVVRDLETRRRLEPAQAVDDVTVHGAGPVEQVEHPVEVAVPDQEAAAPVEVPDLAGVLPLRRIGLDPVAELPEDQPDLGFLPVLR